MKSASHAPRVVVKRVPLIAALSAVLLLLLATVASGAGEWHATGSMTTARAFHSGTLLLSGKVLVAGGFDGGAFPPLHKTAELYDPTTRSWTATGSMNVFRAAHTATRLTDGRVLVAGGETIVFTPFPHPGGTNTAEIYNPATGTWTPTQNMHETRSDHTATLLPNGKVLVAGGVGQEGVSQTAELYDPTTGTWAMTGPMAKPRVDHTALLLPKGGGSDENGDGDDENGHDRAAVVLVVGGFDGTTATNTAELYNVRTGTWTMTGSMTQARADHVMAVLKKEGKVIVAAGAVLEGAPYLKSAELYDIERGTWSPTGSMSAPRNDSEAAIVLRDGMVLVSGGHAGFDQPQNTAELYNPATRTWTSTGVMNSHRAGQTSNLLRNGSVLVAGGLTLVRGTFGLKSTTSADLFGFGEGQEE